MIEFRDVSFTYEPVKRRRAGRCSDASRADEHRSSDARWALNGVSFTMEDGGILGIAGHTGSGKSTLMQLANGLLQPTRGHVLLNGRDLSDKKVSSEARHDVGIVFQYPERQLFAATVADDVAFGPRNLGLSADQVNVRVREALNLVHLDVDEMGMRNPFALSGGQQRRVAFAGVLAMRPRSLILDEPVAGLDPRARKSFLALVAELHERQGLSIAIVSHRMDDLAALCDRVLVLNEGRLHAVGTPAQVFSDEEDMRAIGLDVPQAVALSNSLSRRGLIESQEGGLPTVETLASAIASRLRGVRMNRETVSK